MFTVVGHALYTLGQDVLSLKLQDFSETKTAAMNSIPCIQQPEKTVDANAVTKVKSIVGRIFALLVVVGIAFLALKAIVVVTATLFLLALAHDIYAYNEECSESLKAGQQPQAYKNQIYRKITENDNSICVDGEHFENQGLKEMLPFNPSHFTEKQKELVKLDLTYARLNTTWIARDLYYIYAYFTNLANNLPKDGQKSPESVLLDVDTDQG